MKYILANKDLTLFLIYDNFCEFKFTSSIENASLFSEFDIEIIVMLLEAECLYLMRKDDILLHSEKEFLKDALNLRSIICF